MKIIDIPVGMLGTNSYLVSSAGGACAIIDPGAQPDKIAGIIESNGLSPRYILLTHGHHDHIGGVKRLMALYPEAALKIGGGDLEMLSDSQKSRALFRYGDDSDYIIGSASAIEDGETLELDGLEVKAVATPGHTSGGICYVCGDAVFTGDTLFREDVGRTDLYGGDFDLLRESIAKLAALPGDYTVYPGHGQFSSMAHERINNPYLQ